MFNDVREPPRYLLAMDPGKKLAGIAVYSRSEKELLHAELVTADRPLVLGVTIAETIASKFPFTEFCFVAEYPQIYRFSKGDPNDLLPLAECVGAIQAALVCRGIVESPMYCRTYLPREWKGQVEKNEMAKRIQERITPYERSVIELPRAKSLQHNVWDAIGIGLRAIGRL